MQPENGEIEREQRSLLRRRPCRHSASLAFIDVLVAEDNEVNQIVFTQILQGTGLSFLDRQQRPGGGTTPGRKAMRRGSS
ncbi:hypothetical protein [Rhizobium yanglingense]